ncbi:MAG TPA: ATP-binding protein [Ignavibacteriaceae bacterium]|nr:ATP-binding protein [Ignavibacteriaceae bacterium]
MKWNIKLHPSAVIAITVIIGIVLIISAYLELRQSKDEMYHVLNEQSRALIETITESSVNTINSGFEIEDLITERLLNNARLIKELDSAGILSRQRLINIGNENNLYRINLFDKRGNRILSNRIPEPGHMLGEDSINRFEEIEPILTGATDELIIGLKDAEFNEGQRYAVAVARAKDKGAIVVNLDAKDLLEFRKRIGIGKIIRDISRNSGIEYIALQDSGGILAASVNIDSLDAVKGDKFLQNALINDSVYNRIIPFRNNNVYEVIKRLKYEDTIVGIFRIGLSLDELRNIEDRAYNRIIIMTLVLAAISIITLSILFTSQNLKLISGEFKKFKTFTGSILKNMDEAVIVINNESFISLFNRSAQKLFKMKEDEVNGKNLNDLKSLHFLTDILKSEKSTDRYVNIAGEEKYLSISSTTNYDEQNHIESYTIVLNDITEKKSMEENAKRNEKLTAMGELASGVAHEIRNPINAIGMIAQRLQKEFSPCENDTEFKSITALLRSEVTRINKIIQQFLNYAKPLEINIAELNADDYFTQVYNLFHAQADKRNLIFRMVTQNSGLVKLDPELMKQALMNIIQNAFDAVDEEGEINLIYNCEKNKLKILISDNGRGIPDSEKKKIFDLYYTSRNDGTGIGLSITQKIIEQHQGTITFESAVNKGTTFKIVLPQ